MPSSLFLEERGLCEFTETKMAMILFDKVTTHADMADWRYQQLLGSYADDLGFMLPRDFRQDGALEHIWNHSRWLKEDMKPGREPKVFKDDPYRESLLNTVVKYRQRGIKLIPLSDWELISVAADHEHGDAGYSAILESLPIADILNVSWDQIREFRKDADAKQDLRRLRNWLREGFAATSRDHALDMIASNVDKYQSAISKHGIATRLGVYQYLLDWKNITAILAGVGLSSVSNAPLLGLLGTGAFVAGNIAVKVLEHRVVAQEEIEGEHGPVEFLVNLQNRFDSQSVRPVGTRICFAKDRAEMTAKDVRGLLWP